jgi:hypothetical protein
MVAGQQAVADDGILIDAAQAAGLADAAAFGDVGEDGDDPLGGQARVEQGSALAFGEACFAGAAVEQAALVRSVAGTDGEVAVTASAVIGAVLVLTAEDTQVVHGSRTEK